MGRREAGEENVVSEATATITTTTTTTTTMMTGRIPCHQKMKLFRML
jgi:hypothetical protein